MTILPTSVPDLLRCQESAKAQVYSVPIPSRRPPVRYKPLAVLSVILSPLGRITDTQVMPVLRSMNFIDPDGRRDRQTPTLDREVGDEVPHTVVLAYEE